MKNKNQIKYGFPMIALNQKWKVIGYLNGKTLNKSPLKFEDFNVIQFVGQSGDYYHALGDAKTVLVLTIIIDK